MSSYVGVNNPCSELIDSSRDLAPEQKINSSKALRDDKIEQD